MDLQRRDRVDQEIITSLRHIAFYVPDLLPAEMYYTSLFEMQMIGREALAKDGLWYSLPFDKGWKEAKAAGIELGMVALRKGHFVLALFRGPAVHGQELAFGLSVPEDGIASIRARLTSEQVTEDGASGLSFHDRYEITWQIRVPDREFRTVGDGTGRWLEL